MICEICSSKIKPNDYIKHLELLHPDEYEDLLNNIISLNNMGETISSIATQLNLSQKIISENLNILMEESPKYDIKQPLFIKDWEPKDFKLEANNYVEL